MTSTARTGGSMRRWRYIVAQRRVGVKQSANGPAPVGPSYNPRMGPTELESNGFALLRGVYPADEVADLLRQLGDALQAEETAGDGSIRADRAVYAARNLAALWPGAVGVWRRPALTAALAAALGPRFGMVRALFFDKPPEQTWALPWHKDLTVAVKNNRLPGNHFCHPTRKAGVPHAE